MNYILATERLSLSDKMECTLSFDYKMTWKPYHHPNDFSWITLPYFAIVKKIINCLMLNPNIQKQNIVQCIYFLSPLRLQFCHNFPSEISVRMPLIGEMG